MGVCLPHLHGMSVPPLLDFMYFQECVLRGRRFQCCILATLDILIRNRSYCVCMLVLISSSLFFFSKRPKRRISYCRWIAVISALKSCSSVFAASDRQCFQVVLVFHGFHKSEKQLFQGALKNHRRRAGFWFSNVTSC